MFVCLLFNISIRFQSKNISSCALEADLKKVTLYCDKNLREFDYYEIAAELAHFVFMKGFDAANIYVICDRLASSLDMLKRRGVPIDRLVKSNHGEQGKVVHVWGIALADCLNLIHLEIDIARQQKQTNNRKKIEPQETDRDLVKQKKSQEFRR